MTIAPPGYRLLQVFISAKGYGVFEVSYNPETHEMWCTCPGFNSRFRSTCKHVSYVLDHMTSRGYPVELALCRGIGWNEFRRIVTQPDLYRGWFLKNAKVVVL